MGVTIDDQFRASEANLRFGYKALQIAMSIIEGAGFHIPSIRLTELLPVYFS
jgi:hypothetical protein